MHREHPLRIVRYSIKNIWLLIFPVLRSLLSFRATPESVIRWFRGAWFDLLILLCILGFGWLRWYCRRFYVEKNDICVQEGLFLQHIRYFPMQSLSALTLEYPVWLRPFKGMYLCADTASGASHHSDLRLLIRKEDATLFLHAVPKLRTRFKQRRNVHPWRIILFSIVFSSSLSGAIYTAAFWFQGGRITRELIEEFDLVQRFGEVSEEVASHLYGISPAAVTIGIIVLSTWFLSLVNNLLRYWGFTMRADSHTLHVRSGILTKRSFRLNTDKINYIDLRQNFMTKLCGIFSLAVNCPGYGSRRGAIPVCLPILTKREVSDALPLIFPQASLQKPQLKSPLTAWWGYVWLPLLGAAAIIPAAYILERLFPRVEEVIGFLQLMLLIPCLWKLIIQIAALLTSGVSVTDSQICLRCCKGFVFHTIIAGTNKIVKVRIYRFPWQRWFGKCNVVFYFSSERRRGWLLKNLDMEKTAEILKKIRTAL